MKGHVRSTKPHTRTAARRSRTGQVQAMERTCTQAHLHKACSLKVAKAVYAYR